MNLHYWTVLSEPSLLTSTKYGCRSRLRQKNRESHVQWVVVSLSKTLYHHCLLYWVNLGKSVNFNSIKQTLARVYFKYPQCIIFIGNKFLLNYLYTHKNNFNSFLVSGEVVVLLRLGISLKVICEKFKL